MAPHHAEFLSAFKDKKSQVHLHSLLRLTPKQQVWTRPELFLQNAIPWPSFSFPPVTPVILKFWFLLCFWGGQASEYGNILPDSFRNRAPDNCGHSGISPYPVSENETTAGPEPAEGISADRHKAEPFVQNAQAHLGAVELLKKYVPCRMPAPWWMGQPAAFSWLRFLMRKAFRIRF